MHILPLICSAQQSLQRFTAFQVLEPPVSTGDDTGPDPSPLTGNIGQCWVQERGSGTRILLNGPPPTGMLLNAQVQQEPSQSEPQQ